MPKRGSDDHPTPRRITRRDFLATAIGAAGLLVGCRPAEPEIVTATKGELLSWRVQAVGLAEDLNVSIKGYPEIGRVTVPANGAEVSFRLLALRPGAGFPVVRSESEEPLGRLSVTGAHTADEEAM